MAAMTIPDDVWAVVPVKPFAAAKSRLGAALSQSERGRLARDLLDRTLSVLAELLPLDHVLVVSRDESALALAAGRGATLLMEQGRGLNPALRQVVPYLRDRAAAALLVVAADLPLVTAADLSALIGPTPAIAPDRRRSGTNALFLRPIDAFGFAFGRDSLRRHLALAGAAGRTPRLVDREGLAFDLDLPADLDLLRASGRATLLSEPDLSPA
jgi:2-phospho-L-lactate guanylyltransferase